MPEAVGWTVTVCRVFIIVRAVARARSIWRRTLAIEYDIPDPANGGNRLGSIHDRSLHPCGARPFCCAM